MKPSLTNPESSDMPSDADHSQRKPWPAYPHLAKLNMACTASGSSVTVIETSWSHTSG
ncbi:hypothetical protein CCP3SC15_1700004 [Gammaproteobacteria bacterium]